MSDFRLVYAVEALMFVGLASRTLGASAGSGRILSHSDARRPKVLWERNASYVEDVRASLFDG
jgi:hypothetical protein